MIVMDSENRLDFLSLLPFVEEFPEIQPNVIRDFSAEFAYPFSLTPIHSKHLIEEEEEEEIEEEEEKTLKGSFEFDFESA